MNIKNFKNNFSSFCKDNKFKINEDQKKVIDLLYIFYKSCFKNNFFSKIFNKKKEKLGFYLFGDVGVGKTMLLNFFYNHLDIPKQRIHFNQFMIDFHDFAHLNRKLNNRNSTESFVKELKSKYELIYFDEFQVTNIADAMILGKLFQNMFNENIKIIVTSNIKIKDLYKDGLQRDQFIPFIKIMQKLCIEKELIIEEDYRKSKKNLLDRFFFPLNEDTNFKINQLFRKQTKNKKKSSKKLEIKGRIFEIKNYFEKIARFDFNELCNQNIGAEDFLKITKTCSLIVIDNIPNFNDNNVNQQQRFITLIDILYEKKIPLMTSSETNLENFGSSRSLVYPFKRTLSRLYELTSIKLNNS
jgi:cell division protein ZapE